MGIQIDNGVVNKSTLQDMYAAKLQASFGKFAKATTLRHVKVKVQTFDIHGYNSAPAWSNGDSLVVTFDPRKGSVLAADNLLRLKGLLIHELSHVLYTPRERTDIAKWVRNNNLWSVFNILEDNRIENLMVTNLSGIAPWLIHTIGVELLSEDPHSLLPLVWGRKYLPASVRIQAKRDWHIETDEPADPSVSDEVCTLIDQYIKLNLADTKSLPEVQRILLRFNELVYRNKPEDLMHKNSECAVESSHGKPATKSEQDKLLNQVDTSEPEDDDTTDAGEATDTGDKQEGSDDVENEGSYHSTGNASSSSASTVNDALAKAVAQAKQSVLDDVKATIQTIRDTDTQTEAHGDQYGSSSLEVKHVRECHSYITSSVPPLDIQQASRKFGNELSQLQAEHDPGWLRKTSNGRVNVKQFMVGADFDEMFDAWDDGNSMVSDIECVILLDSSGSMSNKMMFDAYNATWAVKRALDGIGASTTVIQFASVGVVLYGADERATNSVRTSRSAAGGDTIPLASLKHADSIFRNSSRAIKLLMVVTDGAWGDARSCDQMIASMRMSGVLTSLVYLSDTEGYWRPRVNEHGEVVVDAHKCEFATHLVDPTNIVDVAKQITRRAQRAVLV